MFRTAVVFLSLLFGNALLLAAPPALQEARSTNGITWQAGVSFNEARLTIGGPSRYSWSRHFQSGERPSFQLSELGLADGQYTWELTLQPPVDATTLAAARMAGELSDLPALQRLINSGKYPSEPLLYSGSFTVLNRAIISDSLSEPGTVQPTASGGKGGTTTPVGPRRLPVQNQDNVVTDDQIVQGSLCVGLDCVNNESFGFDTIRLKENSTRIAFVDTSTGTGFPANDWQLTANDSVSGGLEKFSIDDVTGAKTPFTVLAGAPTNAMFIDSSGRVGLHTSTPVLDLHIQTSNTPAIRLDQTNASGFTAQTWDIGANEANFFVRDLTSGSRLPFRVRPGAPTSSIDINTSGLVGIGTASPTHALEVKRTDGNSSIFVTEGSTTAAPRDLLTLTNNGAAAIRLEDSADMSQYVISGPTAGAGINVYDATTPASTKVAFGSSAAPQYTVDVTGDLRVSGNLIANIATVPKAGIISSSQFSGNPSMATVTFTTPFPDSNYVVTLTAVSSNPKAVYTIKTKTATGFTVFTDKSTAGLQEIDWMASGLTQ